MRVYKRDEGKRERAWAFPTPLILPLSHSRPSTARFFPHTSHPPKIPPPKNRQIILCFLQYSSNCAPVLSPPSICKAITEYKNGKKVKMQLVSHVAYYIPFVLPDSLTVPLHSYANRLSTMY